MNGSDMSDSVKLGLTMLVLCFLVGIVFQLFTMSRSMTSTSTNRLQSSLNQMNDMSYASYDNQTVYGSTVISAVSQFTTDKMVVVVDNQAAFSTSTYSPTDVTVDIPSSADDTCGIGNNEAAYYGYALKDSKITIGETYCSGTIDQSGDKSNYTAALKAMGNTSTYVNEALRYDSMLIKDDTGETIGVYFQLRVD